ncbi:50S ribosomal protein L17 [Candidatus Saccharibacteria bacterium]|nr:50S ribosomal protein L17 [Candidatus Saccharibacteria bacterium]
MHKHGIKGRKFGRERDQRRALMRGLMCQLVEHSRIKTTLPKAKELRPKMEKVISKAKKGDLANRRRVIAALDSVSLGNYLVDTVAPQIKRDSGYLRIVKLDENRVGDNTEMAQIEFVDPITTSDEDSEGQVKENVKSTKTDGEAK